MLNVLKQKIFKTIIILEACDTLKIDGAFWPNLKSLNKFWGTVKGWTFKLKKRFENSICFAFHLSTYLLLYVPSMQNFKKCMPAKLQVV